MKKLLTVLIMLLVLAGAVFFLFRLGERSGVSDSQVDETLPGDEIIPSPWVTIDRAAMLPADASTSWPWIQQLGKDRAGWYAPMWLENDLHEHSATTTESQFQNLKVGDVVPDWGGGSLKVLDINSGHYVVYGSISNPANSSRITTTNYNFTWALVLEDSTASTSVFHLRLRITPPATTWQRDLPGAPLGLIDWATDIVMFKGLQEKLQDVR